jgi:hypothetical protein
VRPSVSFIPRQYWRRYEWRIRCACTILAILSFTVLPIALFQSVVRNDFRRSRVHSIRESTRTCHAIKQGSKLGPWRVFRSVNYFLLFCTGPFDSLVKIQALLYEYSYIHQILLDT